MMIDQSTRIATAAEERIREALSFEDKTISMHKLEKALKDPNMKELERTLKLPVNTPEDAHKFFESD